nr:mechanosensitive ion channel family protein [Gammaproteobacteria bacterium]
MISLRFLICIWLAVNVPVSWAATGVASKDFGVDVAKIKAALERIENRLAKDTMSEGDIGDAIKEVTGLRTRSNQCFTGLEPTLAQLKEALTAMGEATSEERQEVRGERRSLLKEQALIQGRVTECRMLARRADALVDRLTGLQNALLTARLLPRDLSLRELILAMLKDPGQWWVGGQRVIDEFSGLRSLTPETLWRMAIIGAIALAFGIRTNRRLHRYQTDVEQDHPFARVRGALAASLAHYAPCLFLCGALATQLAMQFHDASPQPFVALFFYGLVAYVATLTVIRTVLSPPGRAVQLTPLPDLLAQRLARRLMVLAFLVFMAYLLFMTLLVQRLPETVFAFARAIFMGFLIINGAWLTWMVGQIPALKQNGRKLRLILLLLLAVILGAEWLGYRNLSTFLSLGLIGTLAALLTFWMVQSAFGALFDGLETGRYQWQRHVRWRLGLRSDEPLPGLVWLRFLTLLLAWGALVMALLRVWGLSDAGFALLVEYLVDGFTVGEVRIVPSKVLTGLFLFALLLTGSRRIKNTLEKNWLRRTRLDAGARETLVTLTSYVGVAVAVLVGLSLAGVQFTNLAIIAGALSVGIGFGLQNIVSNFVSGIILLFERPVRPGDWVVVGSTEGIVKKVRVRATEIQTFDRSDVIVPNSEFISAQVTNWTLRDPYGRLILPVGVAYGSDTDLVRDTMLEVANAHPEVVKQHPNVPAPLVWFRGFGDSALNFELRCFIHDITKRLSVLSDLNFAVDKAFREQAIEIPFPQRDLHVRTWDWREGEGDHTAVAKRSLTPLSVSRAAAPNDRRAAD